MAKEAITCFKEAQIGRLLIINMRLCFRLDLILNMAN
jgi:hypothetical protein